MKKTITILALLLAFTASLFATGLWGEEEGLTTSAVQKDENGWLFLVNGEPFPVYGMVWSYTPVGYDSSYSLWDKDPAFIKRTIDTDMRYLSDMGVNMIRCFDDVPPEWIEYIYHEYGITTMINNLLGRYGVTVDGIWYASTDYADRHTQETLIEMARESARKYKDVDGVVMYMLGNESNYGLVWEGTEIQDLPTENQNAIMASYLYDLLEKAMAAIKEEDPDRVVGFINGDVQNMELIRALCPSLEVFGVNIYRGGAFGDAFYQTVQDNLDVPIVVTESGADAYNAITGQEDQWMQAHYFEAQWKDIYDHAYGKGRQGNIIGAFVFEWLDEWWKIYQYKDLDIHNTNATWGNAGYLIDYTPGGNNMDEEWFGIAAQGVDDGGIAKRVPRAAYYLLSDIWKIDMFAASQEEIDEAFRQLDMNGYLARGSANTLSDKVDERTLVRISNASITTEMYAPLVFDDEVRDDFDPSAKARAEGEVTIAVEPFENFKGQVTFNMWTDPADDFLKANSAPYYNDYNIALNSARISYTGETIEITGHYHDQIGGFGYNGDVFTLVPDQYDNSTSSDSPTGIEFVGAGSLSGFRAVMGTQIYDGASPQAVAGYVKDFNLGGMTLGLGAVAGLEYTKGNLEGAGDYNVKASLSGSMNLDPWVDLELSIMMNGLDKLGMDYLSADGSTRQIGFMDMLGARVALESRMFSRITLFAQFDYRGLVASSSEPDATSYRIYTDGGAGGRLEAMGGATFTYGSHSIDALVRWRSSLEKAARRDETSPFRISSGNADTMHFELSYVYDEEGLTSFYAWNREDVEGSFIAAGLSVLYSLYEEATDNITYTTGDGYAASFEGKPRFENGIAAKANLVLNLFSGFRLAAHASFNRQVMDNYGESYVVNTISAGVDVRWNNWLLLTDFTVDGAGPEQWQSDQGISYPYQWTLDLRYGFRMPAFLNADNSLGVKWEGVVFGAYSGFGYSDYFYDYDQVGRMASRLTVYYNLNW